MDCAWCEEEVKPSERLRAMPLLQMHRECLIRSVFGSMAHILNRCSCFGGDKTEDDVLPGLTKREQAKLAFAAFCKNPPNSFLTLPPRERAKMRPENFNELSGEAQWDIDKALGLLDWDGK